MPNNHDIGLHRYMYGTEELNNKMTTNLAFLPPLPCKSSVLPVCSFFFHLNFSITSHKPNANFPRNSLKNFRTSNTPKIHLLLIVQWYEMTHIAISEIFVCFS